MSHYSLADLEAYDSDAPRRAHVKRRFWCPECGDAHAKDREHRSLALNTERGAWFCHRCQAKGLLKDFWTDAPKPSRKERARAAVAKAFSVRPVVDSSAIPETPTAVRGQQLWHQSTGADEPRCAAYLQSRAVSDVVATQAGVRFSSNWYGRPAVLFPIHNRGGKLIAVSGRFIDGREDPKTQSAGPKGQGVFAAPGALSADVIAVAEGPMDALALWLCGIASVALIGTSWPEWLPQALAFKNVLIATDADDAGDTAASSIKVELEARGSKTFRLRPRIGKDWNESLQTLGAKTLGNHLAPFSAGADNEIRAEAAFELAAVGRAAAARFVASLITDTYTRALVQLRLRALLTSDTPEPKPRQASDVPRLVTYSQAVAQRSGGVDLWKDAAAHSDVLELARVFGGVEIVGVSRMTS